MKLITNDEIRAKLLKSIVDDKVTLELKLYNTGDTDVPIDRTSGPDSGDLVHTVANADIHLFYAVKATESSRPTDGKKISIGGVNYYVSPTWDASAKYNALYITTVVHASADIVYDKATIEYTNASTTELLTLGNNSRGTLSSGIDRQFNFLIALDGSDS